jgi:hypothetical protein
MKKGKRVTHIGEQHVVIEWQHLEELIDRAAMGTEDLGTFELCRKFAVYSREAWAELLERIKTESPTARERMGGTCARWCREVCGRGGSDACIGHPNECIAVCRDGEVYLQ